MAAEFKERGLLSNRCNRFFCPANHAHRLWKELLWNRQRNFFSTGKETGMLNYDSFPASLEAENERIYTSTSSYAFVSYIGIIMLYLYIYPFARKLGGQHSLALAVWRETNIYQKRNFSS
jgi:hypothetical protein